MQVPKAWREQLAAEGTRSGRSRVHREVRAADGTRKFLLQLADGHVVETVGIPLDNDDKHSLTCCVSSQARTLSPSQALQSVRQHGAAEVAPCMLAKGVQVASHIGSCSLESWRCAGWCEHEM